MESSVIENLDEDFIIKGFALGDERLKKQAGGGFYFEELLERFRDIRSSEKVSGGRCLIFMPPLITILVVR